MKSIYIFATALQLAISGRENPSVVNSFASRTLQCRFPQSYVQQNHVRSSFPSRTSARSMKLNSKPEEYDDGIGDITNPKTDSDGEDLVAEFYKSIKEREDLDTNSDSGNPSKAANDPKSSSSMNRGGTSSLFDTNDNYDSEENKPERKLKFTGRDYSGADYFGASANNNNDNNRVRETMMRREYELVSGATSRSAFIFQVGLALSMLTFFLYIGFSGGIVTGDAALVDYGGDDMVQFEQIIPIPRDSDPSVWI